MGRRQWCREYQWLSLKQANLALPGLDCIVKSWKSRKLARQQLCHRCAIAHRQINSITHNSSVRRIEYHTHELSSGSLLSWWVSPEKLSTTSLYMNLQTIQLLYQLLHSYKSHINSNMAYLLISSTHLWCGKTPPDKIMLPTYWSTWLDSGVAKTPPTKIASSSTCLQRWSIDTELLAVGQVLPIRRSHRCPEGQSRRCPRRWKRTPAISKFCQVMTRWSSWTLVCIITSASKVIQQKVRVWWHNPKELSILQR